MKGIINMERIKILVVDDEDEFRQSTAKVLTRRGFDVLEAANGIECLEIVQNQNPNLVILDLRMEGMDGISTLAEMRNRGFNIPVIILSGHGNLQDAIHGIRLEITDFIPKPVDVDFLAQRIRNALDKHVKAPLAEKLIIELMVPIERYATVTSDMSFRDACIA